MESCESETKRSKIYNRLISDENIYLAIFSIDSYILNKELLSKGDLQLFHLLHDVLNERLLKDTIEKIRNRLQSVMNSEYFHATVYFKPKKLGSDGKLIFRPLHTASLIDQISMVAMLHILIYDIDEDGHISSSDLSRLLPSNFYGNRIAFNIKQLFIPWQDQYKDYTGKVNELLYRYSETLEYKYEVNLDLKNFFPSINPKILYKFIFDHIPIILSNDDRKTIQKILEKLIFIQLGKLNDIEMKWYLNIPEKEKVNTKDFESKCRYIKGIAQGLPCSYFFANLYMLEIQKVYSEYFPGRMLFYVDDSVIFTNESLDDKIFTDKTKKINNDIKKWNDSILHGLDEKISIIPQKYFYNNDDFGVIVHPGSVPNSKSVYTPIVKAGERSGEIYLRGISRETSKVGFDIYSTFSDEEVPVLLSKSEAICKAINLEIQQLIRNGMQESAYMTRLLRYRKYFKYRITMLSYKTQGNIKQLQSHLIRDLQKITKEAKDKKYTLFLENYNNDILAATIGFVLKKGKEEGITGQDILDELQELSQTIYNGNQDHSYLRKAYDQYSSAEDVNEASEDNRYVSLVQHLNSRYKAFRSQLQIQKYNKFDKLIKELQDTRLSIIPEMLFRELGFYDMAQFSKTVNCNSDEMVQMMLNSIYSYLFWYDVNDNFEFAKQSHDPIQYTEIRTLIYLRSPEFSTKKFFPKYQEFSDEDYKVPIDYSILQVLSVFHTFVSKPDWVDCLVLTHKYCCDTWKNGSKYLYFYTLHNQEHAVCLIRSVVKILHGISYFQLKRIDLYILFMACYLHDISMVTIPDMRLFYTENAQTNQIYTNFVLNYSELVSKEANPREIRKLLCDFYQNLDAFFEKSVRGGHALSSSDEIRNHPELSFIEETKRELVAEVSEAHGYNADDVYYAKSDGMTSLINKKQIQILLRLADLLDMSRYRISKLLLRHNLENMNEVSRFHWLSHLVTDGYDFSTQYICPNKKADSSYLAYDTITEKITLAINVKLSQMFPITKVKSCPFVTSSINSMSGKVRRIIIKCNKADVCNNKSCNFLCKWFNKKNEYLIPELAAFKEYLKNLQDNYFKPEMEIIINVIENTSISADAFDYLRDFVLKDDL